MGLSQHKATTGMIASIHVLKSQARMDDDTYRDFLERETGKRSAADLNVIAAGRVIDKLREITGVSGAMKGVVTGLDTPVGGKLRALWIAGYDLGLVKDRSDRAMLSFLERQTGVSHVKFLSSPADATAAIEALKSWLARDGDVKWDSHVRSQDANKRAVVDAIWLKLMRLGVMKSPGGRYPLEYLQIYTMKVCDVNPGQMQSHHWDQIQKVLGRRLRKELAKAVSPNGGAA